ncbi:MAG: phytanoyl-CoA dioxygenase family protein [Saprospiraceae bacterium]|nr:phytanoyl-CoA dioxygenase family protein [Saprospiraceae bacterium]
MVSSNDIAGFIRDGYLCIPEAFPEQIADQCLEILWKDTGCDPLDSETWTKPVIRLGEYFDTPFVKAINSTTLKDAFDQLVGAGGWMPRFSLGSVPVRFPSTEKATDTGWHVDASFPGNDPNNYLEWRINIFSDGRALLLLFLFSDVGTDDAPTRIAVGSHHEVARMLAPLGRQGLSFMELAGEMQNREWDQQVLATGKKGTVYLCHPFLLHAAQDHQGTNPRFLAQPPLMPAGGSLWSDAELDKVQTPVTEVIRMALKDQAG